MSSGGGRPARILIVDDEPLNVDYLEQELECHGFVTEAATSGLEALERVAAAPPDLVLMDVMMPGLDGISALRVLKEDPETRLIPVVLMTALSAVEDRVRGIEAGADDFLSKPVDDRELFARIRTALALKRTIDEAVGELRSTSDYLERHGTRERDVAILAVHWRPADAGMPEEAVGFLARRHRDAAERLIAEIGGVAREVEGRLLVAAFDGPDLPSRARAAVDAGVAVLDEGSTRGLTASAAVTAGMAAIGSTRVQGAEPRWALGIEGAIVDDACGLARAATGLVVTAAVAGAVRDRFTLEAEDAGVYAVTGAPADGEPAPAERRMRTILVTDVVGSTRTVERIGDRAGGELLASLIRAIRDELVLYGGDEIDTVGDGAIAEFGTAAGAIRCAFAVIGRARELGLEVRAGVHSGELEDVDGRPRGIALHIASRICARAAPGEVLVSATARDLAAGAGLVFQDRGEHTLKGVAEARALYAALGEDAAKAIPAHSARGALPVGLTAREVDVLRLVAAGLADAEVAERLFVSVRTVNAHLRSIYRKAGVRSRAAAGRFAEENGLL